MTRVVIITTANYSCSFSLAIYSYSIEDMSHTLTQDKMHVKKNIYIILLPNYVVVLKYSTMQCSTCHVLKSQ